ncbi:uncharacterized protein METZ01_LOCUS105092, partial [marine metagenome]
VSPLGQVPGDDSGSSLFYSLGPVIGHSRYPQDNVTYGFT